MVVDTVYPLGELGGEEGGRGEGSQVGERKVLKGNKEAEAAEAGDPEPFCAIIPAIKIRIRVWSNGCCSNTTLQ